MAFVPVPKTVQCNVIGELFGQVIENTLYFAFPDDPLSSQVAQLAASVGEWAVGELCPQLSQSYIYRRTEARDISAEGMPAHTSTTGTGTTGADTNPASPGNVCLAVSFRSGLAGRSYRGRNYISGLGAEAVSGNQFVESTVDAVVEAYEALMSYITDDLPDAVHVIVSRYHLNAPRVTGLASPVLTYLATNRDVDSQRRRLTGRGT